MTKDEILQALHQAAMGRARTPLQVELAEKLAALMAPKTGFGEVPVAPARMNQWVVPPQFVPDGTPDPVQAKRARKQKAE